MDLSADREANIINAGRTGFKNVSLRRAALPPMITNALIIFK